MRKFLAAIDTELPEELLVEHIRDAHTEANLVESLDDCLESGELTPELNALREILDEIHHRSRQDR